MKASNITFKIFGSAILIAAFVLIIISCNKKDDTSTPTDTSPIYASNATVNGKTLPQWAAEWWKWNLQFDCSHCPLYDTTGAKENQSQSGSVFFLGGRRGHTLSVTIPSGVSILLPLVSFESDYPCASDTSSHPAAGESVEHYLTDMTQGSTNAMDQLSLTIDGVSIGNISAYKFISPLFNITANPGLAGCFDDCLTGSLQSFVAGGYFFTAPKRLTSDNTNIRKQKKRGRLEQAAPLFLSIVYSFMIFLTSTLSLFRRRMV